jgi:hypothetical protein
MEDISEDLDRSKYGYEARIYSADGKYEQIFTDKYFLENIHQCTLPIQLDNEKKDSIREAERMLLPLKDHAVSLFIETKGGSVVAKMTLEDFFNLIDIGKRIEIHDRFREPGQPGNEVSKSVDEQISEFLNRLSGE